MDVMKVVKWVLIAIAVWWAWNWIRNNFASNFDTGSSEVYPAPYAAPLTAPGPVTGWSPYWYYGYGRGARGRRRTGRREGNLWAGQNRGAPRPL